MKLSTEMVLLALPMAALSLPQPDAEQLTPKKNIKPKCTPYKDHQTCSIGIELDMGSKAPRGPAPWSGIYVYDSTCTLLTDESLGSQQSLTNHALPQGNLSEPIILSKWHAGVADLVTQNYFYHAEFQFKDQVIASDLKAGARQGQNGNMCNCYRGNPMLHGGGNCERDLCCGCAFSCQMPVGAAANSNYVHHKRGAKIDGIFSSENEQA